MHYAVVATEFKKISFLSGLHQQSEKLCKEVPKLTDLAVAAKKFSDFQVHHTVPLEGKQDEAFQAWLAVAKQSLQCMVADMNKLLETMVTCCKSGFDTAKAAVEELQPTKWKQGLGDSAANMQAVHAAAKAKLIIPAVATKLKDVAQRLNTERRDCHL